MPNSMAHSIHPNFVSKIERSMENTLDSSILFHLKMIREDRSYI